MYQLIHLSDTYTTQQIIHIEVRATEPTNKQTRFIQLRAEGWSYSDIAAELGISKGSCSNWAKRYTAEINKAAAKLKEQGAEPLPKAPKKKAPRIIDITHNLNFNNKPDDLPINHFLSPEFKERYERGEITEQEREGMEILKTIPERIGQSLKEFAPVYDGMMKELQDVAAEISKSISATFKRYADEISIKLPDIGLEKTFASLMASYKPLWEALEKQIKEYVETLPPDVREQLQAEIEQEQAEIVKPENITILDADSGKTKKSEKGSGNTAIAIQNLFQKAFATMLSGAITNHLTTINTTIKKPSVDAVTGEATIKLNNGFMLHIENYDRTHREWKQSTIKLLHLCTALLTEGNHYREKKPDAIKATVVFNISDYMHLLNFPATQSSRKEARKRIKNDLDTLRHSSIDWKEKSRGKEKAYLNTPILGGSYGIDKKGNVIVTFSPQFTEYLIQDAYLMQYSLSLLQTDERNANAYPLGYKLLQHNSIDHNIRVGTADIISVKKALEACPGIPTYEELQAKNDRHWERKIKDALERTLDNIPSVRWEYSNSKGLPLTDEQLADTSYTTFIGLYIHFEVIDAPDQTKRLQAKAERASKRKAKRDTKRATENKGASGQKSGQAGKSKE